MGVTDAIERWAGTLNCQWKYGTSSHAMHSTLVTSRQPSWQHNAINCSVTVIARTLQECNVLWVLPATTHLDSVPPAYCSLVLFSCFKLASDFSVLRLRVLGASGYAHVVQVDYTPYPPPPRILHLAASEQWCWSGGRGILTELSLCYSIVLHFSSAHCTVIMSSSFRLVYWIGLWSHWA